MSGLPVASDQRSVASLVNTIGQLLAQASGVLSAGDVAALRRMDPRRIDAPGFYKLVAAVLEPTLPRGERADVETRWAAIVAGLAHLGDLHRPE